MSKTNLHHESKDKKNTTRHHPLEEDVLFRWFDSTNTQSIMKIYNKPTTTQTQLIKDENTKHISKTGNGYTIRYTKQGTTYYYGEYKTLDEAQKIEYLLRLHNYPAVLSQHSTNKQGDDYRKWLLEKLNDIE